MLFRVPSLAFVLTILAFLFMGLGVKAIHSNVTDYLLFKSLPACEYEDSRNCSWDASARGNGIGTSFYDLGGTIHYVSFE